MNLKHIFCFTWSLVFANALPAQTIPMLGTPPSTNKGYSPYQTALYQMNDVNKSLSLSPQQIAKLDDLSAQTKAQFRDAYTKLDTLTEPQRALRQGELNELYTTDWNKGARNIMTNPQWNRYQQLHYQYGGINSLYYPDIQRQLNMTPQQSRDLDVERAWNTKQLDEINRINATNPAKATQMYQDYWKERERRFNSFLTPDQQKKWAAIAGEPFAFPGPGPLKP